MRRKHTILFFTYIITLIIVVGCTEKTKVRIGSDDGRWQLLVKNQPYFIKGVVGHTYMDKIKAYGGNFVRIGYESKRYQK